MNLSLFIENLVKLDHLLFKSVNQFVFKWFWLDYLGVILANYFIYFVVIFLFLFLLKFKKYWRLVIKSLIAALVARFVITDFIHWIRPRARPFASGDVNLLIDKVNQFAFPSGHAAFSFGLAAVVYFYNKKIGILFFIAAFLISIARVFAGVHWPSDVLAGAIVGIFSGWLINIIFKKLKI